MATHAFPAPPDLSELLKFFATLSYDQQSHANGSQQQRRSKRPTSQRQRPSGSQDQVSATYQDLGARTQPATTYRGRESTPKDPLPSRVNNNWNGSTYIPVTTAKPLKHQILDRTYQPPAPMVVDASGATHLVKRLSKTTVSSRLKCHQADEEVVLAAATAALAGAFERRSYHHHRHLKTRKHHGGLQSEDNDAAMGENVSPPSPPDSRARDGIQTLLMYRREVEKRLSMDPTHFPTPPLGGH